MVAKLHVFMLVAYCKQGNHCIASSEEIHCSTAEAATGNVLKKVQKIEGKRVKRVS